MIPKSYLPTYREFDESRWVRMAGQSVVNTISLCGQTKIPFGTDVLVDVVDIEGLIIGGDICEDTCTPIPPHRVAALNGMTVSFNLSGSNVTLDKMRYFVDLITIESAACLCAMIYASAGFGESTDDVAWDGRRIIADRGVLLAASQLNENPDEGASSIVDIDLEALNQDRMRMGSFHQNAADFKRDYRMIETRMMTTATVQESHLYLLRNIDPEPFVPKGDKGFEDIIRMQVDSLANRLSKLPQADRKLIIAISGGRDSTHALLIAWLMVQKWGDKLGMTSKDITAITMPGMGTDDHTQNNATELALRLDVNFKTKSIKEFFEYLKGHLEYPELDLEDWLQKRAYENGQAWLRKLIELFLSAVEGGIVLGSGTLSELVIGWTTIFGDQAAHYGINVGLAKSAMEPILKFVARVYFDFDEETARIIVSISETPPSPQLLPLGDDGEVVQQSEEQNGPDKVRDFYTYWLLRFGMSPTRILRLAYHAFDGEYELAELYEWFERFISRFFHQHYKRITLAPAGPKLGTISVSPRYELRMPSDADVEIWLDDLHSIGELTVDIYLHLD